MVIGGMGLIAVEAALVIFRRQKMTRNIEKAERIRAARGAGWHKGRKIRGIRPAARTVGFC
jgi:hypothetical protein